MRKRSGWTSLLYFKCPIHLFSSILLLRIGSFLMPLYVWQMSETVSLQKFFYKIAIFFHLNQSDRSETWTNARKAESAAHGYSPQPSLIRLLLMAANIFTSSSERSSRSRRMPRWRRPHRNSGIRPVGLQTPSGCAHASCRFSYLIVIGRVRFPRYRPWSWCEAALPYRIWSVLS